MWLSAVDGSVGPVSLSGPIVGFSGSISVFVLWSADSRRVVFSANRDTSGVKELYSAEIVPGYPLTKLSGALVGGGNVLAFRLSPDSQKAVFWADKDQVGVQELYSVSLTGGSIVKISGSLVAGGIVNSYFQISPDSQRVVFRATKDVPGLYELYSVTIDGTSSAKISGSMPAGGGVLSGFLITPDSTRALFVAKKDSVATQELYSVPIADTVPAKLSGAMVSGGNVTTDFYISPDSQKVVFVADKLTDNLYELFSVPVLPGVEPIKLSGAMVSAPGFVVNAGRGQVAIGAGDQVIYLAAQDTVGVQELYSVPIAGGVAPVKLSGQLIPGGYVEPFFQLSPDTTKVAFRSVKDVTATVELFVAPISGGGPTKVSGAMVSGGNVLQSAFSGDGTNLVFRADKETDGRIELFSVKLGSSSPILDVDGDGQVVSSIDGLILMRWLLGIRGAALHGGITFPAGATRTTALAIEDHLRRMTETPAAW